MSVDLSSLQVPCCFAGSKISGINFVQDGRSFKAVFCSYSVSDWQALLSGTAEINEVTHKP
eukprot:4208851-Amphidinium_carterae.1